MLENVVDEKYYLSGKMFNYAFNIEKEAKGIGFSDGVDRSFINPEIAQTIGCRSAAHQRSGTTNYVSNDIDEPLKVSDMKKMLEEPQVHQIGNCCPTKTRENPNQGRIYDTEGLAPCLNQMGGGNRQPFVTVREATKAGYAEAYEGDSINLEQPNSTTRRGRVGHGVAQTLTTSPQQGAVMNDLRIRKLTPKECFRLQGFDDDSFHKAEAVNSNTQLYKQAGNSICVPVVEYIISALDDAGVFGGKVKEPEVLEGQMEFKDNMSFERYINTYMKESEQCLY